MVGQASCSIDYFPKQHGSQLKLRATALTACANGGSSLLQATWDTSPHGVRCRETERLQKEEEAASKRQQREALLQEQKAAMGAAEAARETKRLQGIRWAGLFMCNREAPVCVMTALWCSRACAYMRLRSPCQHSRAAACRNWTCRLPCMRRAAARPRRL